MKQNSKIFLTFTAGLAAGLVLGSFPNPLSHKTKVTSKPTVTVKYDTVIQIRPAPTSVERQSSVIRRLPLASIGPPAIDTLLSIDPANHPENVADSVTVVVPLERKVWQDPLYRISATGYEMTLDTVEIIGRETVLSYPHPANRKRSRWGVSVSAGYGITDHGLSPFVGIGISYTILTF